MAITIDQIRRLLEPLRLRMLNIAARGVVKIADDARKLQILQLGVLEGEPVEDGEHHQAYGFSSVPLPGAEAVVVFPGGDRDLPLVVSVSDRRYRPTGGEPGEVVVYNHAGASIRLTKDGDVIATPAPGRSIKLGSALAAIAPALASELASLKAAIAAWVPVAGDGGASLKAIFSAWSTPGATKVDVE